MEPQVFIARAENPAPRADLLKPVRGMRVIKPEAGGLWTSSYHPDYLSGWARWCLDEEFQALPFRHWLLDVEPSARVFDVHDTDDLRHLVRCYGLPAHEQERYLGFLPISWEALARDFDGMHLTLEGQWQTRLTHPYSLYGWDCESTLWFRWVFSSVSEERMWAGRETSVERS